MLQVASILLLDCAFVVHLFLAARQLPQRVASHFRADGTADGWLSRRAYLATVAVIGPGLSLIWIGLVVVTRNTATRLLAQHVAWAGCLVLVMIFGVHLLTLRANQQPAERLPLSMFWAGFQVGLVFWLLTFPK